MPSEIPEFLWHLPVWKGLPVPFTVLWVDGVPDFRVIDHEKKRQCVMQRLCAICGHKLGEYAWFVGGPKSLTESNLFSDPPQHKQCAEYAIQTCPFLSGKTTESNAARPIPEGAGVNPIISSTRSEKVGMRRASVKKYCCVNRGGHALILVTRWAGAPIWLA